MYIAVIGGQHCSAEEEQTAYDVGYALAERGAIIVCGGLGGVMEAVCRGAKAAGGTTIGILPGPFRGDANPHVDYTIATDMGQARNAVIVHTADAVIAIGGEYGTLSEIAMSLKMGKRVVALASWELSRKGSLDKEVVRADDAQTAVETALGLLEGQ